MTLHCALSIVSINYLKSFRSDNSFTAKEHESVRGRGDVRLRSRSSHRRKQRSSQYRCCSSALLQRIRLGRIWLWICWFRSQVSNLSDLGTNQRSRSFGKQPLKHQFYHDTTSVQRNTEPSDYSVRFCIDIIGLSQLPFFCIQSDVSGTFNGDPYDDLTTPDCMEIRTIYPQSEGDARTVYYEFGEKCKLSRWNIVLNYELIWGLDPEHFHFFPGRLDRNLHIASLFQPEHKPIYDPLRFDSAHFL